MTNPMVWAGVLLCLLQSAMFSGLTLGLFGLSRLRLEVEAGAGDANAVRILELRKDSNYLLATLLWGNVSVNVLLTILTDSVFTGLGSFCVSTVGITVFGEIMPQAYFSRHASRIGVLLIPFVLFYQFVLFPVAKLTAILLDRWLGKEGISYFNEDEVMVMLHQHAKSSETDISQIEGKGAVNFLELDDIGVEGEGEIIDPRSIITLPLKDGQPEFPKFKCKPGDPFLKSLNASNKKWAVIQDESGEPRLVMNTHLFLRDAFFSPERPDPRAYCHTPIVFRDSRTKLGHTLRRFKVYPEHSQDDVIDNDLFLYWGREKRITTGADILGRLMRGIAVTSRQQGNDR